MPEWLVTLIMCVITGLGASAMAYYRGYKDGARDTADNYNRKHGLTP